MPRLLFPAVVIASLLSGCAGADRQIDDEDPFSRGQAPAEGAIAPGPTPGCVVMHVIEGVIQLHRVVVTLDGGVSDGVRVGMRGVLATGRPFTIISVDARTSRAVITGLNLKVATGTEACLYRDAP